jgi:primosomal protein N' (replication factor Y) (superfamily II helicase)
MNSTLLILPRKGHFQVTICSDCKHKFQCDNCDANLVAYKSFDKFELICHQCQSVYPFPDRCVECNGTNLISRYSGIEKVEEVLNTDLGLNVKRLDLKSKTAVDNPIQLTTRIFDPSLDYTKYAQVAILQAENLLATPDYTVGEEVIQNLTKLILALPSTTTLYFDSKDEDLELLKTFCQIGGCQQSEALDMYKKLIEYEYKLRKNFLFPPTINILLITTQEKKLSFSETKSILVSNSIKTFIKDYPELSVSAPYPAKFLKRKNMYSHHVILKYPKKYSSFAHLKNLLTQIFAR